MWYDDTIHIADDGSGLSAIGRLVKEYDNGICDIIIEYPFGDFTSKAKRIPVEIYGDDWFELIGDDKMLKITYSKKYDKLVKDELNQLNITTGIEQIENNKIILEVNKYPSKSTKLLKTDWESID